jgi:hypothetical protein
MRLWGGAFLMAGFDINGAETTVTAVAVLLIGH